MSRHVREKSSIDIYHVMLRGNNQQVIFEDTEDFRKFLYILSDCKEDCKFELYAYCLMSNHIHLLIRTSDKPLETIFRKLERRFVSWYNRKYDRIGHLFQGRFKSVPVQNERSFLTVLRYIIQNPMKAGIEIAPGTYPWSSYFSYTGKPDRLTDTCLAFRIIPSADELLSFLGQKNDDTGLDLPVRKPGVTDEKAIEIMQKMTGCRSVSEFQSLTKELKKAYVRDLRKHHLSIGQISRITGMAKTSVHYVVGAKS